MNAFIHAGWWVRQECPGQDWAIVCEVYHGDTYYMRQITLDCRVVVDVGAHIGTFSRLAHEKWPLAKIVSVEANPKNVEALGNNCPWASVVGKALYYDKNVRLLDAVYPGTPTSGGSIVAERDRVEACTDGRYLKDGKTLGTTTLEEIKGELELPRIDLLKMDCEGSEYSILENCTCLDEIALMAGEYHGGEGRFREVVGRRLPDHRLHIWNQHDHMGNFWIYPR